VKFDVIADGLGFPEGPIAMADGSVLFVEVARGALMRAWGDGRTEVVARTGGGPNGAAIGPDGAIYICNNGGAEIARDVDGNLVFGPLPKTYSGGSIERVELPTGRVERLYEYCGEHRLSSPNDIVFDRNGGMWFTDMGRPMGRYRMMSGVYYASPDGESISEQFFGGISFNGIGLSPDERTLYVSDTFPARIWSFELEAPGRIKAAAAPFSPIRYLATMPGHMEVDSMALTQSGKLCVATFGIGGIAIVSPDGEIEHRPLPDPFVTNICFGGAELKTAFITAPGRGQLLRTEWPEAGLLLNFMDR
jgi:gluconolactonase